MRYTTAFIVLAVILADSAQQTASAAEPAPQYESGDIVVTAARSDEAIRETLSAGKALEHLDHGALAWSRHRKCVTCHTNGSYMVIRPALSGQFGKPVESIREFFVEQLRDYIATDAATLQEGTRPAQAIYVAAGLAEWDAHVTRTLSSETDEALRLMLSLQRESGTWGSLDCWPPFESSAYHLATVAAMAAATAPGWLDGLRDTQDESTLQAVARLHEYLRTTSPPHDYGRVLLLWTSTRVPGLLDRNRQRELVEMIWSHQRNDGGWSMRTFATPDAWGGGNRADKLRAEPEHEDPPTDGHQTGLCVLVLREAGVAAKDPRLQRAVGWLKNNQRESGRWWTRSLNTDRWHFITYSSTAYALLALAKCNALPEESRTAAAE